MSNLKNSQYGKRLRVSHLAESDEAGAAVVRVTGVGRLDGGS